jgi:hypothetical protein
MAFKKGFSLLLIIALLFTTFTVNAQSQNEPPEVLAFKEASPYLFALIIIASLIIGFVYLIGVITHNNEYIFLAKKEAWQLLLTIALTLIYTGIIYFTISTFLETLTFENVDSVKDYVIKLLMKKEKDIRQALQTANQKQYEYLIQGSVILPAMFLNLNPGYLLYLTATNPTALLKIAGWTSSCFSWASPSLLLAPLVGAACLALATLINAISLIPSAAISFNYMSNYDFLFYSQIISSIFPRYASLFENSLAPLRIILSFYFSSIAPLLPIMAILLRLFPPTRKAGNLIFTLAISFGAVFIFLLAGFYRSYETLNPVIELCNGIDNVFNFGPLSGCTSDLNIPKLVYYIPLIVFIPYAALSISLTFAQNFNKIFDYFEG